MGNGGGGNGIIPFKNPKYATDTSTGFCTSYICMLVLCCFSELLSTLIASLHDDWTQSDISFKANRRHLAITYLSLNRFAKFIAYTQSTAFPTKHVLYLLLRPVWLH